MVKRNESQILLEGKWGLFHGLPPGFAAGFSTLRALPEGTSVREGVRALASALGAADAEVALLKQIHGKALITLEEKPASGGFVIAGEGDALATRESGRVLVVQSADCVPIVLADPVTGWIAAVHAGWRGTALRILDAVLDALEERGASAGNLVAAFGPSISPERYEVGPEVVGALAEAYREVVVPSEAMRPGAGDRTLLDVAAFSRVLLLRRGIRAGRILEAGLCNASRPDLFPSYRRDGPGPGRILTGIVRL